MTTKYWQHKVSGALTRTQALHRKEARLARLKTLTSDRSGEGVFIAAETLKDLLGMPECRDLDTSFYWHLEQDGEVNRRAYDGNLLNERMDQRYYSEHRLLRLSAKGVFVSSMEPGEHGSDRCWKPVSEDQYPEFVRRFQIFQGELEEIRRLITAD